MKLYEAMDVCQCFVPDAESVCGAFCSMFSFGRDLFVDDAGDAAWFQIGLPFNPLGAQGKQWVYDARAAIGEIEAAHAGWKLSLTGMSCVTIDTMDIVYHMLPEMVGITLAVVLVFLAIAFRSLMVALHSVATIVVTLCYVFGFTTLVYNAPGILMWLPIDGVHPTHDIVPGRIYWLNITVCFSIVVGFALDYQIFVLTRIKELRMAGHSTRAAVANGVAHTGGVVTVAGLIMALAFSGLLFSQAPVMGQIGLVLVSGVLFDTFVVRTLLTPAMMSLAGDWNWWPSRAPRVATAHDEGDAWKKRLACCQLVKVCHERRKSKDTRSETLI